MSKEDLFRAIRDGDVSKVTGLLAGGVKATSTEETSGLSALHLASNNVDLVRVLLEKGADVNAVDGSNRTALFLASENNVEEVVELLLEKKADPTLSEEVSSASKEDKDTRRSPLFIAARNGHASVCSRLVDASKRCLELKTSSGFTPLIAASHHGRLSVVETLLGKGANVNACDLSGWSSLNHASEEGHHHIVQLLLDHHADLNKQSDDGWTSLNSAAYRGHFTIVQMLVKGGANLHLDNREGWTPLNGAAEKNHVQVVKFLLEEGASVNKANRQGWTPLANAAHEGHFDLVKILLQERADPWLRNSNGQTAFACACSNPNKYNVEVLELLVRHDLNKRIITSSDSTPSRPYSDEEIAEILAAVSKHGKPSHVKQIMAVLQLSWAGTGMSAAVAKQKDAETKAWRLAFLFATLYTVWCVLLSNLIPYFNNNELVDYFRAGKTSVFASLLIFGWSAIASYTLFVAHRDTASLHDGDESEKS